MPIFHIGDHKIGWFKSKLERIARRARKLHLQEPIVNVIDFRWVDLVNAEGIDTLQRRRVWQIEVIGEPAVINGWHFVATIQHTEEGNIMRKIPSFGDLPEVEVPAQYRDCGPNCEHCNMRRLRRDTYIVRNVADNTFKQVGRTCLGDFANSTNPETIAALAEMGANILMLGRMAEEDDDDGQWHYGCSGLIQRPQVDSEAFLAYVVANIRKNGYTSKKRAYETGRHEATSERVLAVMFPPPAGTQAEAIRQRMEREDVTDADKATAIAALEFAQAHEGDSDFDHNLRITANLEAYEFRNLGMAAYIIQHYMRNLERQAREEANRRNSNSTHQGTVGQRLRDIPVKCLSAHNGCAHEGMGYSYTWLKFVDDNGNIFTWRASSQSFAPEERVLLTGTVKRHSEFRGVKETQLTRCSHKPVQQPEAIVERTGS